MKFSANTKINSEILTALLNKKVPDEWGSTHTFTNACDMKAQWHIALLRCLTKVLTESRPGSSKTENKDFYAFSMEPKFALSEGLQKEGWRQYNLTIRLGKLEGQKTKKTQYAFHFWALPTPCGIDYSKIILLKLKLEGKFVPSTVEEEKKIVELTRKYLDQ